MELVWNEFKKIFTLKIILLLIVVSFIFYEIFISFELEVFPNGEFAEGTYLVAQEMIDDYGGFIDEEEFKDFKSVYDQRVNDATNYLQSREELVSVGLDSYENFLNADTTDPKVAQLKNKVIFEEKIDIIWELQAREQLIEQYKYPERYHSVADEPTRINNLLDSGLATSIFPDLVFYNYNELAGNMAKLIFISVMITLTPIYLKDRKNNLILLQYTTKVGRSLFYKKLIAGLLAALSIATIQLAIFFYLYKGNDTGIFLSNKVNSLFNNYISWFDLSFLQYIILTVTSIYVLIVVISLLVSIISGIVPNYITVIGLQIPLVYVLSKSGVTYLVQDITQLSLPKYLLPAALFSVLTVSVVLYVIKMRNETVKDIM